MSARPGISRAINSEVMAERDAIELAEGVRALDRKGASDEVVAAWLKARTSNFGESGKALALARGLTTGDAYCVLHETATWKAATTLYRLTTPAGDGGVFASANGRSFVVGDTLNLPNAPEPPHKAEEGRGTVWRVTAVEPDDGPGFAGRLVVIALKRL
jgi:hypothetical protein